MSDFGDDFAAAAAPSVMAVFGTSVTYKPGDGDSSTITAALGAESDSETELDLGTIVHHKVLMATIQTDSSDATYGGIADPQINDVLTIGSVDWRVGSVGDELGGLVTLTIDRQPAHRVSRPGSRL